MGGARVMKEVWVRGLLAFMVALTLGITATAEWVYPEVFWGRGSPAGEGILLSQLGYVRWEFWGLPSTGEHLLLELSARAEGAGAELPLCLRIKTPGMNDWRTYRIYLQRVQVRGDASLYFGQVCLARRDLALGSQLSVRIDPFAPGMGIEFKRDSLRIKLGNGGTAARPITETWSEPFAGRLPSPAGGPVSPRSTQPPSSQPSRLVATGKAPVLPETEKMREAAYIAPGKYTGELGWAGPGSLPDASDWFLINLLPGQTVSIDLTVDGDAACSLSLYDPQGEPVASIRAGREIGLQYKVDMRGGWYLCVASQDHGRRFQYELLLEVRPAS